jgi:HTH-type transcriptional regulator/antitoxin MqsA
LPEAGANEQKFFGSFFQKRTVFFFETEGDGNLRFQALSDRALNRLKAQGLLEPEEIRRIRKKLRLTQEAAGEVIGGGPRAFQRYESGDALPSRAISSALILLDHQPAALGVLTARHAATTEKASDMVCISSAL